MNLLERLRPFRAFDLIPLGGTLSLLGALCLLALPEERTSSISLNEALGFLLLVVFSHLAAVSLTDRRGAGLLMAGLALTAGLGFLDLIVWPPRAYLPEIAVHVETRPSASSGDIAVILIASLYAVIAAWKCRSALASILAALVIACLQVFMFESFIAGPLLDGFAFALLLLLALALSLLPWPGRSLRLLPYFALGLAVLSLDGIYSETHWPGGYLVPALPFVSRASTMSASLVEWAFRLLFLAVALAIYRYRLYRRAQREAEARQRNGFRGPPDFLLIAVFGTVLLLAALCLVALPESIGDSWFWGALLLFGASHLIAVAVTERRAASLLLSGLALIAGLAFLELVIWPSADLLEGVNPPDGAILASSGAAFVLALAALYAFPAAWRVRGLSASTLAAVVIACFHVILFEYFILRPPVFDTRLPWEKIALLVATTLALSLLPWPRRSLLALPAIALGLALLALEDIQSATHWPGGYLLPSLPFSIADAEEWRLRLLLLGIALFITALRLAWRWRRR